ncbi:SAVED domain-containing protein [Photorhabdus temperata subsp. temperata]
MANFDVWCDSVNVNLGANFLQKLTARGADFDNGVLSTASIVPHHYASPENIATAFELLGKPGVAGFIKDFLPISKQTRSGDIGEILATEWINARSNGYKVPLNRLRWKDHRNLAMRGEDVIGMYIDPQTETLFFLKTEAKSRARMNASTITDARNNLDKGQGLPTAHALAFIATRLLETGKKELGRQILKASLSQGILPGHVRHLIFLLSGNASDVLLTTSINAYQGNIQQFGVTVMVARHGEFIQEIFDTVISHA